LAVFTGQSIAAPSPTPSLQIKNTYSGFNAELHLLNVMIYFRPKSIPEPMT